MLRLFDGFDSLQPSIRGGEDDRKSGLADSYVLCDYPFPIDLHRDELSALGLLVGEGGGTPILRGEVLTSRAVFLNLRNHRSSLINASRPAHGAGSVCRTGRLCPELLADQSIFPANLLGMNRARAFLS